VKSKSKSNKEKGTAAEMASREMAAESLFWPEAQQSIEIVTCKRIGASPCSDNDIV